MSARTIKGMLKGLALAAAFVLPAFAASSSSPAPTFQLSGRGGKTIDLSQFKGQVVMINFWATWCVPCRQEMPLLEDIYKKYKPMGFTMLAVNVEPDSKAAEAWLGAALVWRISSLSALIAIALSSAYFLLFHRENYAALALLLSLLIYFMHRDNIRRLMRGEEPRIGAKSSAG